MVGMAFGISQDDVEQVLRDNAPRLANPAGKSLEALAAEIFDDIDAAAVERAALDGGTEMDEQTDAAHEEIARQLEEAGVLTPLVQAPEDEAYARYDFGDGVRVVGADGWQRCTGSPDVTRFVYVHYDDDAPEADSHRLTFTVRLQDGQVESAGALDRKGNEIGYLPEAASHATLAP